MAASAGEELRQSKRLTIPGFLPGSLLLKNRDDSNLKVHPIDISKNGLGLIIDRYYPPGTRFTFVIKNWYVTLEMVWCQREPFMKTFRRCGLVCQSQEVDLVGLVIGVEAQFG